MSEFDLPKLRRLDLALLLTFLGLMRHGKAADVAAELGVTQSTISHALRRLREVFDDDLFIRKPHGLEPTAFAIDLEPQVHQAVTLLDSALTGQEKFDPTTSTQTLRISALDHSMATLLPAFVARVNDEAPHIRLIITSMGRDAALNAFSNGELELAVGFFWNLHDSLLQVSLRKEPYLVVGQKNHPMMKEPISLANYCQARHIIVTQKSDMQGVVDQALHELGLKREVVVSVPLFFSALTIVSQSNLLAVLPATLVRHYAQRFDLVYQEPPLPIRRFTISVVRHKRNEKNQAVLWAINLLKDLADGRQTDSVAEADSVETQPLIAG